MTDWVDIDLVLERSLCSSIDMLLNVPMQNTHEEYNGAVLKMVPEIKK